MGIITLLTDFGFEDPYVGIMKGVILGLNPTASLVDLTHLVGPGNIYQAAHALRASFPFFPPATIHLAVVDPGVGTDRRPILVKSRNHLFVGPDNGLFWPVISADPDAVIIHLTKREYFLPTISHTFHGRDVFSPVAAHLTLGVDPYKMGEIIRDPIMLARMEPVRKKDALIGRTLKVDHFGNIITNIHQEALTRFLGNRKAVIQVAGETIKGIVKTFADGMKGELLALIGSTGHLEIAVNSGRADRKLAFGKLDGLPEVVVKRV